MATFVDRDALLALVQTLTGPLTQVTWDTQPAQFQGFTGISPMTGEPLPGMPGTPPATDPTSSGTAVEIVCSLLESKQVGWDDYRRKLDTGTNRIEVTTFGTRYFTLSVSLASDGGYAFGIAERLRSRFQQPGTLEALEAIGCNFRGTSNVHKLPSVNWNGRQVDSAALEVFLGFGSVEVDPLNSGGVGGNWIETVAPLTWKE